MEQTVERQRREAEQEEERRKWELEMRKWDEDMARREEYNRRQMEVTQSLVMEYSYKARQQRKEQTGCQSRKRTTLLRILPNLSNITEV
jgi:hypothetical protein